jgi:hypothetical protein
MIAYNYNTIKPDSILWVRCRVIDNDGRKHHTGRRKGTLHDAMFGMFDKFLDRFKDPPEVTYEWSHV